MWDHELKNWPFGPVKGEGGLCSPFETQLKIAIVSIPRDSVSLQCVIEAKDELGRVLIQFCTGQMAQRYPLGDQCVIFSDDVSHLRWFMLPSEAQDLLLGNCGNVKTSLPFTPTNYVGSRGGGGASPPRLPSEPPNFARHKSLSSLEIRRNQARYTH